MLSGIGILTVNESEEEKDAEWCNTHNEVSFTLVTPYSLEPPRSASAWRPTRQPRKKKQALRYRLSLTFCVHVAKETEDDLHFHHSLVCGLS